MPIYELFSERQRRLRGDFPDVLSFDEIPESLRIQVLHITDDAIGFDEHSEDMTDYPYKHIRDILCREYGKHLLDPHPYDRRTELHQFFLKTKSTEQALDVVELLFRLIDRTLRDPHGLVSRRKVKINPDEAIGEVNERFKKAGVGYAFENGKIIRLDSTYVHAEITQPAIKLLWNDTFSGANDEYMIAHEHYRHGRNEDCITNCLKAFESTLKIICDKRGWIVGRKDTAGKLIDVCVNNGLIPEFLEAQNRTLQSMLKSGVPTIRNNVSGHGQGNKKRQVNETIAKYCLNLTGANIIFLIDQSGL